MKKIFSLIFILISGLAILLATVDLEPYLAPKKQHPSPAPTRMPENDPEKNDTDAPDTGEIPSLVSIIPPVNLEPYLAPKALRPSPAQPLPAEDAPEPQPGTPADDPSIDQSPTATDDLKIHLLPEGDYPFSILLETFNEQESARKAIASYLQQGISAYWVKVNLGNNVIKYRLFTGIFPTPAEAQKYLVTHNLTGKLIKPTVYSARIGIFNNKEQLTTAFAKTSAAGVVPYILATEKDIYSLYVGAFYTFVGATTQCRDLIAEGLSCLPVKRSTLQKQ
jgi:hypothetical protein